MLRESLSRRASGISSVGRAVALSAALVGVSSTVRAATFGTPLDTGVTQMEPDVKFRLNDGAQLASIPGLKDRFRLLFNGETKVGNSGEGHIYEVEYRAVVGNQGDITLQRLTPVTKHPLDAKYPGAKMFIDVPAFEGPGTFISMPGPNSPVGKDNKDWWGASGKCMIQGGIWGIYLNGDKTVLKLPASGIDSNRLDWQVQRVPMNSPDPCIEPISTDPLESTFRDEYTAPESPTLEAVSYSGGLTAFIDKLKQQYLKWNPNTKSLEPNGQIWAGVSTNKGYADGLVDLAPLDKNKQPVPVTVAVIEEPDADGNINLTANVYAHAAQSVFPQMTIPSMPVSNTPLDDDGDGVPNGADNCPYKANNDQTDLNANKIGDACEPLDPKYVNQYPNISQDGGAKLGATKPLDIMMVNGMPNVKIPPGAQLIFIDSNNAGQPLNAQHPTFLPPDGYSLKMTVVQTSNANGGPGKVTANYSDIFGAPVVQVFNGPGNLNVNNVYGCTLGTSGTYILIEVGNVYTAPMQNADGGVADMVGPIPMEAGMPVEGGVVEGGTSNDAATTSPGLDLSTPGQIPDLGMPSNGDTAVAMPGVDSGTTMPSQPGCTCAIGESGHREHAPIDRGGAPLLGAGILLAMTRRRVGKFFRALFA